MPKRPSMPKLTVRAIRATAVEIPLNFVLGTSMGAVRAAPLLLIDLETEEGVTGRNYLFCYLRAAAPASAELTCGRSWERARRSCSYATIVLAIRRM